MSSCVERSLYQAATSTFEVLGFMVPDRKLSDAQRTAAEEGAVSVGFHGPLRGRLVLRLYGDVLRVLTANMLGGEGEASAHLRRDALGEIANVICGNVLPLIAGSRETFRLDPPRPEAARDVRREAPRCIALGLAGGRAEVGLDLAEETS